MNTCSYVFSFNNSTDHKDKEDSPFDGLIKIFKCSTKLLCSKLTFRSTQKVEDFKKQETRKLEYLYEFLSIGINATDFECDGTKQIQTTCLVKIEMVQHFLTGLHSFRVSMCHRTTRQKKKQVSKEMVFC